MECRNKNQNKKMTRILILNHKENRGDTIIAYYLRFLQEIPDVDIKLERKFLPENIANGYDVYLVHPSSTDTTHIKKLREDNPHACIISISDMELILSRISKRDPKLDGLFNAFHKESAWPENLDRITETIKSHLEKRTK